MDNILTFVLVAAIVLLLFRFVFHFTIKTVIKLAINALVGFVLLYLVNLIPGLDLPINVVTSLIVGLFGFLGFIGVLIYSLVM